MNDHLTALAPTDSLGASVPVLLARAPSGLELPAPLLEEVASAYASAGRVYHVLDHVVAVATEFAGVRETTGWKRPREVYLAVLYHDAIYVPGAADNEARSAALARTAIDALLPRSGLDGPRVADLIVATGRHGSLSPSDVDDDTALFLDCDMAILGAAPALYDGYARAVAGEYIWLPEERYRLGRLRFLEKVLASRRIFLSPSFHLRLEAAARVNMARELEALSTPR